jgi:hypothetical protein
MREYGIDLVESNISWRKFIIYVGALSPESVFIQTITQKNKDKPIEDTDDIIRNIQMSLSKM